MILIFDAGSTKTHCAAVSEDNIRTDYLMSGINPFYQSEDEIADTLCAGLCEIDKKVIDYVYFYGAGCSFEDKKNSVFNAIQKVFGCDKVLVESDLLGAARSLFGKEDGVACILGTGSNSCHYKDGKIASNVSPLGFVLGDEGSGAVLGRKLVADCMKGILPEHLRLSFYKRFKTSPQDIMESVYKKPFPNRYLASFAVFLSENINERHIRLLVKKSFEEFLDRNVCQYNAAAEKVSFVGSISYYFSNILAEACAGRSIEIGKIEHTPMDGLVRYHSK